MPWSPAGSSLHSAPGCDPERGRTSPPPSPRGARPCMTAPPVSQSDPARNGKTWSRGVLEATTVPKRKPMEGTMRHHWMIGSMTLGAVLGGLLAAGPAGAVSKKVDEITCEEFLALKPDDQQRIAYWVDGYETSKGEAAVGVVA